MNYDYRIDKRFIVGCVLTWLSMANMIDSSYQAGYIKGFSDSKQGVKDADKCN